MSTGSTSSTTGCEISVFGGAKDMRIVGGSFETCVAKIVYESTGMLAPPPAPNVQGCSIRVLADTERIEVSGEFTTAATIVVPAVRPAPLSPYHDRQDMSPPLRAYEVFSEMGVPLLEGPDNIQLTRRIVYSESPQPFQLSPLPSETGELRNLPSEHVGLLMRVDQ